MAQGVVKWFSDEKGFGFITPDESGKDLFVHHTDIQADGFRTLAEGARVEYSTEAGAKGPKAVEVRPVWSRRAQGRARSLGYRAGPGRPAACASHASRGGRVVVSDQVARLVDAHGDGVHGERDVIGVGPARQVAVADRDPRLPRQDGHPLGVHRGDRVAHAAGAVVELARGGGDEAAAGEDVAAEVGEPGVGDGQQAGAARRGAPGAVPDLATVDRGAAESAASCSSSLVPKWPRTPALLMSRSVARRPIVRPSRPSSEARSTARARIASWVRAVSATERRASRRFYRSSGCY